MILDMSLQTFTFVHVVLSLVGLAAGAVALLGMLSSRVLPGITALFLLATTLASATGFLFPSTRLGVGHVAGVLSLLVLAPTLIALYFHRLAGRWRAVYAAGATAALWLNTLIGVRQAFAKVDFLLPLAYTPMVQTATQAAVFAGFVVLGGLAVRHFHPCAESDTPLRSPIAVGK